MVDFDYLWPIFDLQTHTAPGDPEKRDFAFAAQNGVKNCQNRPHLLFFLIQIISSFWHPDHYLTPTELLCRIFSIISKPPNGFFCKKMKNDHFAIWYNFWLFGLWGWSIPKKTGNYLNFTKKWVWVDFRHIWPLFDLRTHWAPRAKKKRDFAFAAQNMVQSGQNRPQYFFLKNSDNFQFFDTLTTF